MIPGWVQVTVPADEVMAPPAFVQQVQAWARQTLAGERTAAGRITLRVLRQDHSVLRFGRSCIETPMRIGSRAFAHGLGTHANSDIVVEIPDGAVRFEASVGVDNNEDTGGQRGSVEFAVEVQGSEVLHTPVLKGGMEPVPVMVRIPLGAKDLRLRVYDGGDGVAFDQADWGEAAFVMADGSRRLLDEHQLDLPMLDAMPPFSFRYGGKSSAELLPLWQRTSETRADSAGIRIRTTWQEPGPGLAIIVEARAFRRYPAVEWVVYAENRGAADTAILEDFRALDVTLASGFARLPVTLHHLNGDTCSATSFAPLLSQVEPGKDVHLAPTGGRPSSMSAFPFWNVEYHGAGLIVGIGWTGQWSADLSRQPSGPTRIQAGMELLRTILHPGERIRTPRVLIMPWAGDRLLAHVRFRRLMLEHFTPSYEGRIPLPPLAIQSFDRYHSAAGWATEAGQLAYARMGADLGFDSVWLDAAWFPGGFPNGVGTWEADPTRFPRGLKPVADAVHAKNQRFVLWFEPERVASGSAIAREHPEWVFGGAAGGLFKLNDPQARAWLTDLLIRRIREYGVDVYRNDFNIDPLPYCRAADTPDRQGMTEIRYVEGLYEMWDAIRNACPGVLIDNCASGGRRLDLEMMTRSVPLWRSDTGCSPGHPDWNQLQTMSLAQYLPLFTVGLWSAEPYDRRSAATAGVPVEVPYLTQPFDPAPWKVAVSEMNSLRPYWYGDFYPLCGHSLGEDQFVAWQIHRADLNAGAVYAFRRHLCQLKGVVVSLKGIKPRARYRLEYLGEGVRPSVQVVSGKDLVSGITLSLPKAGSSLVVRYSLQPDQTRPAPSARKKPSGSP